MNLNESDNNKGIYQKFRVERTDGSSALGGRHENCRYFVLDLDHDKHAPAALRTYAHHCVTDHPALAHDLLNLVHAIEQATPLVAWLVDIHGLTCIVFASTKDKAKWIAVKGYWDAYGRDGWPRPTAVRSARYDNSALRFKGPLAWVEDYVRDYPNANTDLVTVGK